MSQLAQDITVVRVDYVFEKNLSIRKVQWEIILLLQ